MSWGNSGATETANTTGSMAPVVHILSDVLDSWKSLRDPADGAAESLQTLLNGYERLKAEQNNARVLLRAARENADGISALLTDLGIPEHCASGPRLTLAQRVTIALHESGQLAPTTTTPEGSR